MEDIFDTTGRPPSGWMHAIFSDGPFMADVGRCVPGPPPPDPLIIAADAEVDSWTYRLVSMGSWSDPLDPIAIYANTLPPGNDTGWWADRRT